MALPWVRLDSNIATHDKILTLMGRPNGARAAWAYVCGLAYSGGHGTDGLVPGAALPHIHGTPALAKLLVDVGLWELDPDGWRVPHWAERQQSSLAGTARRAAQSAGARKANCIRWHGRECGCWADADQSTESVKRVSPLSQLPDSYGRTDGRTNAEVTTEEDLSRNASRTRRRA